MDAEEDEEEMDPELAAALAMSMQADGGAGAEAPAGGAQPGLSPALQNLISNIQSQASQASKGLDLADVLDTQALLDAIKGDTAVQDMLVVHLPEELQTREELSFFISSPQFKQTVRELQHVLASESMYSILMSMGVDPSAAPMPGVDGFLQALISTLSKHAAVAPPAKEPEEDLDADLYD